MACLRPVVALAVLSRLPVIRQGEQGAVEDRDREGPLRSSFRSQIDSRRMCLPQALAGYNSQQDPLRDLASSITLCLREPHLARGSVRTSSGSTEGHQQCGLHLGQTMIGELRPLICLG